MRSFHVMKNRFPHLSYSSDYAMQSGDLQGHCIYRIRVNAETGQSAKHLKFKNMKHFYSIAIILAIVMVISCQKEVIPEVTKIDAEEVENSPMTFNSLNEMLQHIEAYNSTTPSVKSMVPQQLSYAVTVMQEDGYDDRPDAIMSEAFGSVLSPKPLAKK